MRPVAGKQAARRNVGPRLAPLFFFLLGAYPLLSFLWRRSYPLPSTEVALLVGLAAVSAMVLSLIASRGHKAAAWALTSLVITAALLVQFDLSWTGAGSCLAGSLILLWALGHRFFLFGSVVLTAMLAGAWLDDLVYRESPGNRAHPATLDPDLPPVIHIVLDSFIGLDGLPDHPESAAMRADLLQFFEAFGMQVFPRAYSRYFRTSDSLYAALNYRDDGDSEYFRTADARQRYALPENAWFASLENLGYRFRVYQTRHLDFCLSHPASTDRCWVYDHPNVATVTQVAGPARRAGMLARVLVTQSAVLTRISRRWLADPAIAVHDSRVIETMQADILDAADGQLFLAHALLPHGPFAFTGDCSIRYEDDPSLSYAMVRGESNLRPDVYDHRVSRYFEQVRCALKTLRGLFGELRARGIFERAIVVLHGDHGSLIGRHFPDAWNLEKLTWGDYRAHFSTLFAVKLPGGKFAADRRALPLSHLVEMTADSIASAAGHPAAPALPGEGMNEPRDAEPHVFLSGRFPLERVDVDIFRR